MKSARHLDTFGAIGLLITAIFSPCCFPLFAFVATALGLGSFELFGGWTMWVFQTMVVITLTGLVISYFRHRCLYPLLVAVSGALLIFFGLYFINSDYWIYCLYAGMAILLLATLWNNRRIKMHGSCPSCQPSDEINLQLKSTITCPSCHHRKTETMPTDACVYYYECEKCHKRIKPLPGDCCVFCSYGTVKCPPMQVGKGCC